jgi:hypothetical protein
MDLAPHWDYIEEIAAERSKLNDNVHYMKLGEDIMVLGAAGELAARLVLNLPLTLSTGFDNGIDFLIGGKRVDVKTTKLTPRLEYRYLQWPKDKPIKCDIVWLFAVDIESMNATSVGYSTARELISAPINYDRKFPCHEIPVRALKPHWWLVQQTVGGCR